MAFRHLLALLIIAVVASVPSLGGAEELAADLVNDPWLSEQGPAVTPVAVAREDRVRTTWSKAPPRSHARTAALHRLRLESGLADLVAPAHVVLTDPVGETRSVYSGLARDLAPNTPSIQMAHARALWAADDIGGAIRAAGEAFGTILFSLAVQLWLIENVAFLLLVVVLGAALGFLLLAGLEVFSHAAHDLGDLLSPAMPSFARVAALSSLILLPLCFGEGVLGVSLALFGLAFIYGKSNQRSVLVIAALLLVIGLHPLAQLVSGATSIAERDPVLLSAFAVVQGTASPADIERLDAAAGEDRAAAHAMAYHARRFGQIEESRERLEAISGQYPSDPVALTNRGNIEMRNGNTDGALANYEGAANLIESPELLFSLSQAYAGSFRMEEYERTLSRAQQFGAERVSELSAFDDAHLVADLGYPMGLLRSRLIQLALSLEPKMTVAEVLAPGILGKEWVVTCSAFVVVALVSLLLGSRFDHASLCIRCGHRICTRCEETVWSEDICEDCHHLFQYPEATDPSLRMARLQALSERDVFLSRVWLVLSLICPGAAGIGARRPDFAMFGLILFGIVATWAIWPAGAFQDPLMMGAMAWLFFAVPGVIALLGYAGVTFASVLVRKHR
ncbi:MAG: tetratricopeptide repeat protein [Myxococcota bacterium]